MKGQYRAQLEADMEYIEVDELQYDGKPVKVYFRPMNLESQGRIYKAMGAGDLDFMARSLIERARYEDGSRMFTAKDMTELKKHADGNLIQSICQAMTDKQNEETPSGKDDIEAAVKN